MATPAGAPRPPVPARRRSRLALARARHRSVLRRPTDRWRSALVQLQLLAAVAAAALCAMLGLSVYQHAQAHALAQARQLRPVQAQIVTQPYASGVGSFMAQVSWSAPDGKAQQGITVVPTGGRVGDRTRIWLDPRGNLASAPASSQDVAETAVLTGLLTAVCVWSVVVGAGAAARGRLDRKDERTWESEWSRYEPLWTHRG